MSFIKLHRKLKDSEVYKSSPVVRELFIYLLMNVGWQTNKNIPNHRGFERGNWRGTTKDLQDGLSWNVGFRKESYSRSQIQRGLAKLTNLHMIGVTNEHLGISVNICNYDTYQGGRADERAEGEQSPSRERATPSKPIILYNNNNNIIKEDKEEKEVIADPPISNISKILNIVEPVFGNLKDPFYGLGGLQKWGTIVAKCIKTYTFESVEKGCKELVKQTSLGVVQVNNPDTFFNKGLSGYIVRANNSVKNEIKSIEGKKWLGHCISCDATELFTNKPKGMNICKSCGEDEYVSAFEYSQVKSAKAPKPKPVPVVEEPNEDKEKVMAFLGAFK